MSQCISYITVSEIAFQNDCLAGFLCHQFMRMFDTITILLLIALYRIDVCNCCCLGSYARDEAIMMGGTRLALK